MKTPRSHFTIFVLTLFLSCSFTQCAQDNSYPIDTEDTDPSANTDPQAATTASDSETASTNFTTLAQGTDADLDVSARKQIADSQDEMQSYWELLFPGETAPTVNFTNYHVAFLVMGEQTTSGSSIEITSIEMTDIDFDMLVAETSSGSGCAVTQAFTNPYHIVQIDKASEDLRRHFVTESVEQSCE